MWMAAVSQAQTFTNIFDCQVSDCYFPVGALAQGADGNLYGVGSLAIFKISTDGTLTIVHTFGGSDGSAPRSGLLLGADGNFYGTTETGGANGNLGTIYEITPTGTLTTIHSFGGSDGSSPFAPLIQASDGSFYGTTEAGGTSSCRCGTVFRIGSQGKLVTLHSFSGATSDGGLPFGALVQATDGNFYGTTSSGGTYDRGTVFKITSTGLFTILHSFKGGDGKNTIGTHTRFRWKSVRHNRRRRPVQRRNGVQDQQ